MPELPEVEAVVQTLRPLVRGQRIRCVDIFHPIATHPQSAQHFAKMAERRRIVQVERRGKYLLLMLDLGLIEMHFRLGGQLVWFSNAKELLKHANAGDDGVRVDVALELSKGVAGIRGWQAPWTSTRVGIGGGLRAAESAGGRRPVARIYGEGVAGAACAVEASGKRDSAGSDEDCGDWEHLLVRGVVAGTCGPSSACEFIEQQGS